MKKRFGKNGLLRGAVALLLLTAMLLAGCAPAANSQGASQNGTDAAVEETQPQTEATVGPTVPADGNPDDVTCKGSYTVDQVSDAVVASVGDAQLTNEVLQAFYWMEVAAYRQAENEVAPDFDQPLDTQECPLDETAVTWQQYFLQRALNSWHSAQALIAKSAEERPVTEEVFQQNEELHETYLPDVPVKEIMYGYNTTYTVNERHQAYLDTLPEVVDALTTEKGMTGVSADALLACADIYNRGYMFFTELTYDLTVTEEEVAAFREENGYTNTEKQVDVRHLLVLQENADDERSAKKCLVAAQTLLNQWKNGKATESTFAALANKNSADTGTALNGGLYSDIRQGQLMAELDAWCFDEARKAGDSTVIQTELGCHVLYFCGSQEIGYAEAETALLSRKAQDAIRVSRKAYPMEVTYSAIGLCEADGSTGVTPADLLYPDVAHERYTQVPVYLQQDYRNAPYGNYYVSGHGCGITALAMLATYMADETLTPAMLAAMYGNYCHFNGTDTTLFIDSPPQLGFYFDELAFNWKDVNAALEKGRQVITLQLAGYFTTTGHFLVLENIREDGLITVRDSNIYNYTRLSDHMIDGFRWQDIVPRGIQYWIYQEKILSIPGCSRCGEAGTTSETVLSEGFCCEKCVTALTRRNAYLTFEG